jgi:hypothetical protein
MDVISPRHPTAESKFFRYNRETRMLGSLYPLGCHGLVLQLGLRAFPHYAQPMYCQLDILERGRRRGSSNHFVTDMNCSSSSRNPLWCRSIFLPLILAVSY